MHIFEKQITFKMNLLKYIFLFLLFSVTINAQVVKNESREAQITPDTTIFLSELIISKRILTAEEQERIKYLTLQRRIFKTYPYAKAASERLDVLYKNLEMLKTEREKRKYIKIVEQYIEGEFKPQLKKLSRKDGQILVKLMYRQTGVTTFDLVKNLKSGWKAFWSNNTARLFDINLKTEYDPFTVSEDYMMETILMKAFIEGKLIEQESAHEIDHLTLIATWEKRTKETKSKEKE